MAKNCKYKVIFSVDDITLKKQQEIFDKVLSVLNYTERQNLHITVIDPSGGQHNIWDNTGIDPNCVECKRCTGINCAECIIFEGRTEWQE